MALTNFMNENFPNLELRPALFYSWDIGIRTNAKIYMYKRTHLKMYTFDSLSRILIMR